MRRFLATLAIAATLGGWSTSASAELITNGGFETGDFTGWSTSAATLNGDLTVGTSTNHSGIHSARFGASSPNYYDTLSQAITTVAGQSYTFQFWLNRFTSSSTGGTQNYSFIASFDGSNVLNLSSSSNPVGTGYTLYSNTVTATSTQTTVSFAAYNALGFFYLDDVSVTPNSTPAVPEPSSLVLAGLGALGLVAGRRLRARRVAA